MARLPRLVLPGYPHHVTQRGNRRSQTFFKEADYALYRDLLAEAADKAATEIWCCLMPNHVHLIVVPSDDGGLRRTFADRIPASSTPATAGPAISGKAASAR
ncbi:transposase [Flavisphingomonas formosensis]|uniref:transposase n=1 Tax=Flavisphingomonas formosensis TaxID=861534 RepID=UPI0018DFFD6D|nr:transposase [Sphingomonas formosensis]